jgi:hypothetical protein
MKLLKQDCVGFTKPRRTANLPQCCTTSSRKRRYFTRAPGMPGPWANTPSRLTLIANGRAMPFAVQS